MNLSEIQIGFLGTGKMATALAAGFTRRLVKPTSIRGADPLESSRTAFAESIGDGPFVSDDAVSALKDTDVLFLSVKPQTMKSALQSIEAVFQKDKLVVSIAAGLTISTLEGWLPNGTRLIRVMPNTPCLVGKGASGMSRGTHATTDDERIARELLQTVGVVEVLPEKLLDAVTGLSGSGPAYVFQMIEALSDGGVKMGLPRDIATRLAAQTLSGAAEMVLQTGQHPGALKDAVTSPGGTTIAGLHELERGSLRATIMNAVEAATRRSIELG